MRRGVPIAIVVGLAVLATAALAGGSGPKTKLVSKTSGGDPATGESSFQAVITPDGRFVAFASRATNLPGDGGQVYVRDLKTQKTKLVSKTSAGDPATSTPQGSADPSISSNGRFVAFESDADNLPEPLGTGGFQIYVRDLKTGKTRLVSKTTGGEAGDATSNDPSISGNGRRIAFESEATNLPSGLGGGESQVYVRDLETGKTKLVSKNSGGEAADGNSDDPSISRNGRWIAFESEDSTNLPGAAAAIGDQAYVRDLATAKTKLVSKTTGGEAADDDSDDPILSPNGRFVGFESQNTNLPGGLATEEQAYVRDLEKSRTVLVSKTNGGDPASGGASEDPHPSNDGQYVVFSSAATNLVGPGTQVYLRDRAAGKTRLVSKANDGLPADADSFVSTNDAVFTVDARFAVFQSSAANLPGSASPNEQVYIRGPLF